MNRIWFIMMLASFCFLFWTCPDKILSGMIEASSFTLNHVVELCGIYAIWLGILELVEASGLGEKLAKLLHPIIKKLFKLNDNEAERLIALNISANMLGLGNAATPLGIKAMKKLDDGSGIATPAVIMLIVLNATSIQLLPTTIIGMRASNSSMNAEDIILPTLIATILTCSLGIILVNLFQKFYKKRKKL